MLNIIKRTNEIIALELLENRCRYHESCYASFANIGKLQSVKQCYATSVDTDDPSAIKLKSGRPSLKSLKEKDPETVRTKSKSTLYVMYYLPKARLESSQSLDKRSWQKDVASI